MQVNKEDNFQKRIKLATIILLIGIVLFTLYFVFLHPKQCEDQKCFTNALESCKKASMIRKDAQASWLYEIKGKGTAGACEIEVILLEIKQGKIDSARLEGRKMTCNINRLETKFPEKDISKCTGKLKEELQDLLIKRMHDYLLTNLGEIKEDFTGF